MKLIYALSLIVFVSLQSLAQQPKVIDKIVAQVGDNVILLSDIQAQKIQAIQAKMTITPEMECQILEDIMYRKLLLTQAKLDSLEVTDAQVDAEMENRIRVIENQIGGRQKMEEFYGKTINQIKKEFHRQIKDHMLTQEMEHQITSKISVTPREVETFFKSLPYDSIPLINSQLSFQQIVFYPEITLKDKQLAADNLRKIRQDILAGKSFTSQARIHSMDPGSASQGGEIKASRGMMVKPFDAAVFSLEIGGVSDVFETEYGYHIVKLIDRKGDDYTCQHILIIPEYNSDALTKAAFKMDSCYRELKSGKITWEDAVTKYSNDESTRLNKGIITNPITGNQLWDMEDLSQVDQQIYILTDALEKGDFSDPGLYTNYFERKEGIRIVRLMERTVPHRANLKDDYALIKRAAENNKKQKTIDTWIQSKISNAYITIDESYQTCLFNNPWLKK